jgi:hypothetical protein
MMPWLQRLFCETCWKETIHRGRRVGLWEVYRCLQCETRKRYKVG